MKNWKNARIFFEKPGRVYFCYAVELNLFRLGSSVQKHAGSRGASPVWGTFFFVNFFFVLKSSETYAKNILPSALFEEGVGGGGGGGGLQIVL